MTRLYVVSEGLTEATFVREILAPHIEHRLPEPALQMNDQPANSLVGNQQIGTGSGRAALD